MSLSATTGGRTLVPQNVDGDMRIANFTVVWVKDLLSDTG